MLRSSAIDDVVTGPVASFGGVQDRSFWCWGLGSVLVPTPLVVEFDVEKDGNAVVRRLIASDDDGNGNGLLGRLLCLTSATIEACGWGLVCAVEHWYTAEAESCNCSE